MIQYSEDTTDSATIQYDSTSIHKTVIRYQMEQNLCYKNKSPCTLKGFYLCVLEPSDLRLPTGLLDCPPAAPARPWPPPPPPRPLEEPPTPCLSTAGTEQQKFQLNGQQENQLRHNMRNEPSATQYHGVCTFFFFIILCAFSEWRRLSPGSSSLPVSSWCSTRWKKSVKRIFLFQYFFFFIISSTIVFRKS